MKIVETDNFGGDYPEESFLLLPSYFSEEHCQKICDAINSELGESHSRFWKVVPNDYKLQPGFEP